MWDRHTWMLMISRDKGMLKSITKKRLGLGSIPTGISGGVCTPNMRTNGFCRSACLPVTGYWLLVTMTHKTYSLFKLSHHLLRSSLSTTSSLLGLSEAVLFQQSARLSDKLVDNLLLLSFSLTGFCPLYIDRNMAKS